MRCLIASLLLMAPAVLPAVDKTATIGLNVEVLPACQAGSSSGSGVSFGTLDFGTHLRLDNLVTLIGQPDAGALRVNCQQNIPYRVLINAGYSGTTSNRQMVPPTFGWRRIGDDFKAPNCVNVDLTGGNHANRAAHGAIANLCR